MMYQKFSLKVVLLLFSCFCSALYSLQYVLCVLKWPDPIIGALFTFFNHYKLFGSTALRWLKIVVWFPYLE